MKLKHLFTFIALTFFTLIGFTACDDDDYAPITLTSATDGNKPIQNKLIIIDAFSEGEHFYIVGGNGHYTIENKNTEIVDYRFDGQTLTFIPIGVGEATIIINDRAGNRLTLTIQVQNHTLSYKITSLEAKAIGKDITQGETEIIENKMIDGSILKEGGDITFTYTNEAQTLGSVTIHPTASGRPIGGIFRQQTLLDEEKVPYREFTITFADNNVVVWTIKNLSKGENPDMQLEEDVTNTYKGIYPKLEKAVLTYKIDIL